MKLQKMAYKNNKNGSPVNLEIVTFKQFYSSRPHKLLESDVRLGFWTVLYITKGSGIHSIDFIEYNYKQGDLIVIEKNRVHSYRINNEVEGYIVNINEPFFIEDDETSNLELLSFFETPYDKPILSVNISIISTNRQLIDILHKEYIHNTNKDNQLLIRALFRSFVYSIRTDQKDEIRVFSKISYEHYKNYRDLVEKNYKQLKSVEQYTKFMGISSKTINLVCRECADLSAKQLIINRVILEVKRQLIKDDKKNYEISYELGFVEPGNLSAFFKRYTGISMMQFKKLTSVKY